MTRLFSPYEMGNRCDRFSLEVEDKKGMKLAHPWKELLSVTTGKANFTTRNYLSNEMPSELKRAIFTRRPDRHVSDNSMVSYVTNIPCVLLDDADDWDSWCESHRGDDVIAFAEINFDK